MENYGIMEKNMVLYGQNYGTILRIIELRFTKKKSMVDYQILRNFDLLWKNYGTIEKTMVL